jgi:DNA repair protein RadD
LTKEFVRSGVRAEHLDGTTPRIERDEILQRLSEGDLDLVVNCMVLTEGWDQPDVSCCVLAQPTKSMGLYRQMAGRVIRPFPGKDDAIIIDHAGATFAHGFIEDEIEWSLSPDTRAASQAHALRGADATSRLVDCSACGAIRLKGEPCPECGFMPKPPPKYVAHAEGNLTELYRQEVERRRPVNTFESENGFRAMLEFVRIERNYKPGWLAYKFKERFGHWPPSTTVTPVPPSAEVRSWVRSRDIAFASAARKAAGDG